MSKLSSRPEAASGAVSRGAGAAARVRRGAPRPARARPRRGAPRARGWPGCEREQVPSASRASSRSPCCTKNSASSSSSERSGAAAALGRAAGFGGIGAGVRDGADGLAGVAFGAVAFGAAAGGAGDGARSAREPAAGGAGFVAAGAGLPAARWARGRRGRRRSSSTISSASAEASAAASASASPATSRPLSGTSISTPVRSSGTGAGPIGSSSTISSLSWPAAASASASSSAAAVIAGGAPAPRLERHELDLLRAAPRGRCQRRELRVPGRELFQAAPSASRARSGSPRARRGAHGAHARGGRLVRRPAATWRSRARSCASGQLRVEREHLAQVVERLVVQPVLHVDVGLREELRDRVGAPGGRRDRRG